MKPLTPHSPPRSCYVHVPFCRRRCGYCNFTLIADRQELIPVYLDCLEIELSRKLGKPHPIETLFLGGGTPTHLAPEQLERLTKILAHWLPLESHGEYSCEANPLDCSDEVLDVLRSAGVNRLSIGGQSFNDQKLQRLERDHSGEQLSATLELAKHYFDNISLDLIFAAPQETLSDWRRDVELAMQSPIQHLSTYGLTIERGTQFFNRSLRGELGETDDELELAMYLHSIDRLSHEGWQHYEVSNFCKPDSACRHNLAYWKGSCWLAFGPGAASFLPTHQSNTSMTPNAKFILATNHRSTTEYIKRIRRGQDAVAEVEPLSLEAWIRQRLVFGLRRIAGVNLNELESDFGQPIRPLFEPYLTRYLASGWLECDGPQLRLTRAGLIISDNLWPPLLS